MGSSWSWGRTSLGQTRDGAQYEPRTDFNEQVPEWEFWFGDTYPDLPTDYNKFDHTVWYLDGSICITGTGLFMNGRVGVAPQFVSRIREYDFNGRAHADTLATMAAICVHFPVMNYTYWAFRNTGLWSRCGC